ncbi:MAG: class I SAM-dependent methyltransferase [Myxococcota bacterium]
MLRRFFLSVISLSALLSFFGCRTPEHSHHTGNHRFDDADAWAARFEDPSRDAWQKPDAVLATLALPPDAKVADIGSATGYFPVRFAKALPQGRVFGMDVEQTMVDFLNKRAATEGLSNLSSALAAFDDAKIPEPVDLIIMVNTYHHIEHRPAYFAKLAGSLKPGGRLVIIDFTIASKMGPPAEAKVPPEQVTAELTEAGYKLAQAPAILPEQFFHIYTR